MNKSQISLFLILISLLLCSCGSDSVEEVTATPKILTTGSFLAFENTNVEEHSTSQSISVEGEALTGDLQLETSVNFEVSIDDIDFGSSKSISASEANSSIKQIYVRFSPGANAIGLKVGSLKLKSTNATDKIFDLSGQGLSTTPLIETQTSELAFETTTIGNTSPSKSFTILTDNLTNPINLSVDGAYEISLNDTTYSSSLQIPASLDNQEHTIFARFIPQTIGQHDEIITISNSDVANDIIIDLSGSAIPVIHNYDSFESQRLAFGGGFNQTHTAFYDLHDDLSNVEQINMYVKLRCPAGGCNAWDVFANIKVKDPDSGEWFEIGRYITPYGIDNSQAGRGFEIDVTDFKSLLQGNTELYARIETWGADGWELTVDFDYVEGTPDYPYYAIAEIITYDDWSTSGVPYGIVHAFDLDKTVSIPSNAEATSLRTIITGWGHATPTDQDGRPCAEWCYRTHNIKIDGGNRFMHDLDPIGCANNPVGPQLGNWTPDRAGWCPGMAVPVRIDNFSSSMANSTFSFEYDYENWTADGGSTSGTPGAYYATSCFVVVKSNTPIVKPTVTD